VWRSSLQLEPKNVALLPRHLFQPHSSRHADTTSNIMVVEETSEIKYTIIIPHGHYVTDGQWWFEMSRAERWGQELLNCCRTVGLIMLRRASFSATLRINLGPGFPTCHITGSQLFRVQMSTEQQRDFREPVLAVWHCEIQTIAWNISVTRASKCVYSRYNWDIYMTLKSRKLRNPQWGFLIRNYR
jgi:hypothetical protein